ncbi:unnamed protein product [Sphenostylis stenocarpa]|uniref:Uncharacterized protein n=1 Tax=Sphenostylis stenocarpa TaxID=92480 RepID=A0AA86T3Q7_9FABA|nr:unnamed protein product [Sphenostylis stenocarpa]
MAGQSKLEKEIAMCTAVYVNVIWWVLAWNPLRSGGNPWLWKKVTCSAPLIFASRAFALLFNIQCFKSNHFSRFLKCSHTCGVTLK